MHGEVVHTSRNYSLRRSIAALAAPAATGVPIVGLEPSCTAVFRGDAAEFLTLAERLHIKVTTTPYTFGQADQALADLAAERVHGAAVLSM